MMNIPCPHCGPRPETEFRYGGEAVPRPADSMALDEAGMEAFLYTRDNEAGVVREQWVHQAGCRLWIWVTRCRTTHRIEGVEAFEAAP